MKDGHNTCFLRCLPIHLTSNARHVLQTCLLDGLKHKGSGVKKNKLDYDRPRASNRDQIERALST